MSRGRFKNTCKLVNLGFYKISLINKLHIFQCIGKIFCVEFQRVPLKFHTKYLTHTLKDTILYKVPRLTSSYVFLKSPPCTYMAPETGHHCRCRCPYSHWCQVISRHNDDHWVLCCTRRSKKHKVGRNFLNIDCEYGSASLDTVWNII